MKHRRYVVLQSSQVPFGDLGSVGQPPCTRTLDRRCSIATQQAGSQAACKKRVGANATRQSRTLAGRDASGNFGIMWACSDWNDMLLLSSGWPCTNT